MKKIEVLNIYNYIANNINDVKTNKEYALFLVLNENIIKPIVSAFDKEKQPASEAIKEYLAKRDELILKHSDEDEVMNGSRYVKRHETEFLAELKILDLEYNDAIQEHIVQTQDFNDFLDTEYNGDIEFYKIKKEDLPKEIEPKVMYIIKDLISV